MVAVLSAFHAPTAAELAGFSTSINNMESAWSPWTPTLTNLTLGNGSVVARYLQVGKTVEWRFKFTLGSTSAVGSTPQFTLPAAPHANYSAYTDSMGTGALRDASSGVLRAAQVWLASGSTVQINRWSSEATADITATAPWTWATSDVIAVRGTYEAA